jgi:transcriptional regulator with XRE-family HTH domain
MALAYDDIPEWTLGDRFRKARRHAGLTQQQISDQLRVDGKTVKVERYSNWEADINKPRGGALTDVCLQLEAITGFPADWLAGFRTGSSFADFAIGSPLAMMAASID